MKMFTYKNKIYRKVALTPQQKSKKKDYLLEQGLHGNKIPSLDEVLYYLKNVAKQEDRELYRKFGYNETPAENRCKEGLAAKVNPRWLDPDISEDEEEEILAECRKQFFKKDYDNAVDFINYRAEAGRKCYRAVLIPEHIDPASLTQLGIFWTTVKSWAYVYRRKGREGNKVVFQGRIDPKYIDLFYTVVDNFVFENSEAEVRFLPNAPILVEGYYVEDDSTMISLGEMRRC